MDFETALKRVTTIIITFEKAETDAMFDEGFREEAKADRVALEIVTAWATKMYKRDTEKATAILNALHV